MEVLALFVQRLILTPLDLGLVRTTVDITPPQALRITNNRSGLFNVRLTEGKV